MKKINYDTYCIKVNDELEKIMVKLSKKGYRNINLFYTLDIYMTNKPYNLSNVEKIGDIPTYAIIRDFNGQEKEIIFNEDGEYKGKIVGMNSTKSLLLGLGFSEILYINKDVYEFVNEENTKVTLVDVKDLGIFLTLDQNIVKKQEFVKKLRLNFDSTKFNVIIEEEFIKHKKGIK